MGRTVLESDFQEGGIFEHLILPKFLPIPKEILQYIYANECPMYMDCGMFCLDISSEINLLKRMWQLKGVEMVKCLCAGQDHLLTLEELNEQNEKYHQLKKEDFQENGIFAEIELFPKLPLNPEILKYIWGDLNFFDKIPDGKCIKSNDYQLNILQKCFHFKNEICTMVCPCNQHLNFII